MIELSEVEVGLVSGGGCGYCAHVHDHPHPDDNEYGDIEAMFHENEMF